MPSIVDFFPMIVNQQAGSQSLGRTPEPERVTDAADNVLQYDQVMKSKLALGYAAGIEGVYRARPEGSRGAAVDLACGPGHYTICLARHLDYNMVTGVDLSAPMVDVATQNSSRAGLSDRVVFKHGDATKLDDIGSGELDLASFTGAAHHMPDLETVAGILREMDRITKPEGLVMVMDLARLRTEGLTERYIKTLGHDYVERGLPSFLEDFRNSMYAVWTPREFRTAIPTDSQRWWCHVVPRGLPTVQMIFGLPVGRKKVFLRPGFRAKEHPLIRQWYPRWEEQVSHVWAKETLREFHLMRTTLAFASKRMFPPGKR